MARFLRERPKATLKSMKVIVGKFGGLPTQVVDPETNMIDLDMIGFLALGACQQMDPDATEEDGESQIDMGNLHAVIDACTHFMTIDIPEELRGLTGQEQQPDEDSEQERKKRGKGKNSG